MTPEETSAAAAVVAAAVAILAAIVAALVPFLVEGQRQKAVARELKIDCLRRVAGLRSMPPTQEWLSSLNEACVVFNEDTAVVSALRTMSRHITQTGGHSNAHLLDVMKAMLEAAKLDRSNLDDEFLLTPFMVANNILRR